MRKIDTNTLLSALWLIILLNMVFRDIHQIVLKSELEIFLTGTYNGVIITEELMLLGGLLAQVPIAMVLLSLLLARRVGRPVTVLAACFTGAVFLSSPPTDLDDIFHLAVELAALAAIVRVAWVWPREHAGAPLTPTLYRKGR